MKRFAVAALSASFCIPVPAATGPSFNDPPDVVAAKQMEREMGDAMMAADVDKLNHIFADDWITITRTGQSYSKADLLRDFQTGKNKLLSYQLGPLEVQVLGDVAVGHGTVAENRTLDGKNFSAQGVWMDLLEKRKGKWVVVRSEAAFAK